MTSLHWHLFFFLEIFQQASVITELLSDCFIRLCCDTWKLSKFRQHLFLSTITGCLDSHNLCSIADSVYTARLCIIKKKSQCRYVSRISLTINKVYFPIQPSPIGLSNGSPLFCVRWILNLMCTEYYFLNRQHGYCRLLRTTLHVISSIRFSSYLTVNTVIVYENNRSL